MNQFQIYSSMNNRHLGIWTLLTLPLLLVIYLNDEVVNTVSPPLNAATIWNSDQFT